MKELDALEHLFLVSHDTGWHRRQRALFIAMTFGGAVLGWMLGTALSVLA